MMEDQDRFEEALQEDLRRMADEAPAGPGISQVKLRLRRRRIQRFAWASMVGMGVAALIIIGTVAYLYLETIEDMLVPSEIAVEPETMPTGPMEDVQMTHRPPVTWIRPVPIPRDASDELIRQMFGHYMKDIGAEAGTIEKRVGEDPAFTLVGDVALGNEDLLEEIEILLENFDEASLALVGSEIHYSLSRMER